MTKVLTFNSEYLPDFPVVEQWDGNTSRFPSTSQLPQLLRALNLEFKSGLPDKIARVNNKGNEFMKMQLHLAAGLFCSHVNKARRDSLRLHALIDRDKVARIAIVQQITEHVAPAPLHRFKFYAGDDFFTEIYLNNKRIVFADHALERFSERVPDHIGADLSNLLVAFFGFPASVMGCNKNCAFAFPYRDSVIAFPVRQSDTDPEYFLPTCLSGKEINQLDEIIPPIVFPPLYSQDYREPASRNWNPIPYVMGLRQKWTQQRTIQAPEVTNVDKMTWPEIGHKIPDIVKRKGHGEGSKFLFRDNIPGHSMISLPPGKEEERHVELDDLKKHFPDGDWERLVLEQRAANSAWYDNSQTSGTP